MEEKQRLIEEILQLPHQVDGDDDDEEDPPYHDEDCKSNDIGQLCSKAFPTTMLRSL